MTDHDKQVLKRLTDSDRTFFLGVGFALQYLHSRGEDVFFDEIVAECGADNLIAVHRKSGQMNVTGLAAYVRKRRGPSGPVSQRGK